MTELVFWDLDSRPLTAQAPFDALVLVAPGRAARAQLSDGRDLAPILQEAQSWDAQVGVIPTVLRAPDVPGGRLVFAPTGPLSRDFDDPRRFSEAARAGLSRALAAGATKPLLLIDGVPAGPEFTKAKEAGLLGALSAIWIPLQAREARELQPIEQLGFAGRGSSAAQAIYRVAALEAGRALARDIAGPDPERMTPARIVKHAQSEFQGSPIELQVVSERSELQSNYPLLCAVGRASFAVARHHPRVLRLRYTPKGPVERTLLLAGKGVVYDTGGADIKAGGHMAGMSRDKGGAAAVLGLMKTVAELSPARVQVLAEVGLVRNSVGADAFVADEIITSHAGVRVRIGNTDAEGRLVLADLLSHLRERARSVVAPRIFSVATLTGHAVRTVGPYTVAIDNGPARKLDTAQTIAAAGEAWAEPAEISRIRREDWDFVQARSTSDDVLSCNNAPSTATQRGHQFPMAFMAIASGLDRHGIHSPRPLPYTHLDISGSVAEGADLQHGRPTGAPILALSAAFLLRDDQT